MREQEVQLVLICASELVQVGVVGRGQLPVVPEMILVVDARDGADRPKDEQIGKIVIPAHAAKQPPVNGIVGDNKQGVKPRTDLIIAIIQICKSLF